MAKDATVGAGNSANDPKNPSSGLRASELAKLEQALHEERAKVLARLDRHVAVGLEPDTDVGDEGDQASAEFQRSNALGIAGKENKLLAEIDRALAKFAEGTYGVCEGTGEAIEARRLHARPWARYSVAYKEELERTERGYVR